MHFCNISAKTFPGKPGNNKEVFRVILFLEVSFHLGYLYNLVLLGSNLKPELLQIKENRMRKRLKSLFY